MSKTFKYRMLTEIWNDIDRGIAVSIKDASRLYQFLNEKQDADLIDWSCVKLTNDHT